jgi:MFS family permease
MRGGTAVGSEWWRPLPPGASADALRILAARGVRAFGDGYVALLLPIYLVELGFSALAIGTIVTSTLIGTALLTLWVGWIANRHSRRLLLLASAGLMAATGAGVVAFVGTMNPTSGDASIFVPLEQTVLTQTIAARQRTALFARYSVVGSCATALGVLAAAVPDLASVWTGCTRTAAMQLMFALYAGLGWWRSFSTGLCRQRSRLPTRRPQRRWGHRRSSCMGWPLSSAWIRSAPASWCNRYWRSGSMRSSRYR